MRLSAKRMRLAPRLERFLHVGTAYICGAQPPPLVREDDYPQPNARHLVEYTRTKAECEILLERDLPYREIHRQTGVSITTIGRVARYLTSGNGGYRAVTERLKLNE